MSVLRQLSTESAEANLIAGKALKAGVLPWTHYGIYAGNEMVIHNSKEDGKVAYISMQDFANGRAVYPSGITSDNPYQAFLKAKDCLGKNYDLFDFNCEHFVRHCHGLPVKCHQKEKILAGGSGLIVTSQIRNPALKVAAGGFCVGTVIAPETEDPIKMGLKVGAGALVVYGILKGLKVI